MKKHLFVFIGLLITIGTVAQTQQYPKSFTVAKDGSGNFTTIQDAIYAVRDLSQQQVSIFIKKGVYNEKLIIPSWKTNISLIGEDRDQTIITYNDYAGKRLVTRDEFLKTDTIRTYTSYTVLVKGNDCRIENITIKNTAGRVGQAVALHVEGDKFVARNCSLLANQDTYYAATENSRQYLQDCFIEGTTDFIFGEATVVFQNCIIKNLTNSYITAAATRPGQDFGFVFFDCKLIADTNVTKAYLGRPWRPYAKTVFIRTEMGNHILKEGWDNWRNAENEKTVLYAEYKSFGEGGNVSERVKWSRQLSNSEVKNYTLKNIFKTIDWINYKEQLPIVRDTSFTIQSAFVKEKKKRPYIIVAAPEKPTNVILKTDIAYRNINGRDLLLDIFYPKKTRKLKPTVLMIFGGGWRSGDKSQNHAMAIELAKNGYVAVSAEYRLSPEATYPAAVHDLKAAVRWMRSNARQYGIDTSKIAVLGCSAGGQLAALLGTTNGVEHLEDKIGNTHSSYVQACIDIDGILAFKHPESEEGTVAAQWLGGTYEQKPEVWKDASPLYHVDANTVPMLFINSSFPRFHAGRTDMINKMDSLHIYSEIHEIRDTPHPFWFFHPWFNDVMKYTVAFLNKVFKYEQ